ncbi:MAG TPA: LysR substrate-binding domain-containing protein [Solirubrobacter sp.]|nr:LysR substrate-binding domain-containing protein [Solirubrobacter sp.]
MDLRQLRYFVAVAEELHFSRAALRLNLAQSALSGQIRTLEQEIGGPLLARSTRRVELTPAGAALLEDAREVLAGADEALARARALARGESGALVIGSLGPAPGGVFAPLLARFGSMHPNVRVEVRALDFTELIAGVRERHADVAFLYLPLDEPDLEITPLLSEPRVVVLPSTHRLATRATLSPADLDGEVFVKQPPPVPDEWCDFWMLVDDLGHRPPASPHMGANLEEWLHLIGRGEGIDTAPAVISRYYSWPEVAFVPLVDAAPAVLVLARRRDTQYRLVDDFVKLAVEIAGTAVQSNTPYSEPTHPSS